MKDKDRYDIIIDNITKEWYKSMNNNILTRKWEYPKYSKKQIDKAGQIITNKTSTPDEIEQALDVLNNWRSAHAYPLQVIASNLRRNNPNAIVVQRLKRLDSISGKLIRFPNMSLYRMQDLGGCRVIVDNIEQVYETINRYKHSKIRHIVKRENDYIQLPKTSGYRSYHIVYKFHSDNKDTYNKNMLIEIQFRTKLQHIWATAIEVMGIYTKSQLKASIGNQDILRFFVLASSVLAKMENTPVCPNTTSVMEDLIKEMKEINNRENIISKLKLISAAIEVKKKIRKQTYYILKLNFIDFSLEILEFTTLQIDLAIKIYNQLETFNDPNTDVVLVSANSFDALKAAYPNYFADITEFSTLMSNLLE